MKENDIIFEDLLGSEQGWECFVQDYEGMPRVPIGKVIWETDDMEGRRTLTVKYYPIKQRTVLPMKKLDINDILATHFDNVTKSMARKAAETLIHTTVMF